MKLILAALMALTAVASAADWPMFRGGPERLGRSPEKLGGPVKLLWKKELGGAIYSSPAIVSGTAYFGNSNHFVYAYDLSSGEKKWKTELPERVYGSSPQVEGSLLYIACVNGCVYSLNTSDGAIQGSTCVKKLQLLGHGPDVLGSPLVSHGKLYFGSDNGEIYGFNLADGKKLWSYLSADCVHDSGAALSGDILYIGSTDGHLYALDKDSGRKIWGSPEFKKINSTPLVHEKRIYIGAGDNSFRCLDTATGSVIWSFETGKGVMSSPALSADGKRVVFGGADGFFYCLGLDGKLQWKFETGGPVLASPLVTGDSVWVGSFDRHFYGVHMSDGKKFFDQKCGAGVFSSAAASGGKLLFGDREGGLFCVQASLN